MCHGRILSAPTTAAAEPPTGRLVVDPYRAYAFNRVLAKNRGFRADAIRPYNKCIY